MTTSNAPAAPVMQFVGLCGAIVDVHTETPGWYRWACHGCDAGEDHRVKADARKNANGHASTCRALPRT